MFSVLSRVLIFALLIVDWVEDPHYGNYLFSRPMSSSEVSSLDLGFRESGAQEEVDTNLNPKLPVRDFGLGQTLMSFILLEAKPTSVERSLDSMYAFMSLQI